ncbi:hypothetical protein [Vibrio echinoideorum]|uniref:hypothetical protein n=1 Tax=Vibrio echinoideorum TaxID=2100116 RepID=UPI00354E8EFE
MGSNVACTLLGLAVTGITKSTFIGSCAGVACGVAAGNIDHTERQGPNHNGGAYHGHAGGMDGSNSGFGR